MIRSMFVVASMFSLFAVTVGAQQSTPSATHTAQNDVPPPPSLTETAPRRPGPLVHREFGAVVDEVPSLVAYHLPLLQFGALIEQIDMQGPLAKSGLRTGDIIFAVDGRLLQSARELQHVIAPVRLLVYQAGRPVEVQLPGIGPMPQALLPVTNDVQAISMALPQGTLAINGMNGRYKLEAKLTQESGQPQVVREEGGFDQILAVVERLPEPLRTRAKERLLKK